MHKKKEFEKCIYQEKRRKILGSRGTEIVQHEHEHKKKNPDPMIKSERQRSELRFIHPQPEKMWANQMGAGLGNEAK